MSNTITENNVKFRHKTTKLCRYISKRDIVNDMFKKIIKKLQFGSCKTQVVNDVNAFKESEKKKPEDVEK
ncbi:MAG: hypothetical protein EX284_06375 [Candidatus Nitrosopumilus sp. MTA1]|uniref:Uncharacterized protein n=1 Tax=Marine Group I thaumarchaeote TaxID=2511932 RepID=A0A7K4N760_9ARCH|nr:MAG: hypothetical protein DSN69_08145 [Nitrosopumilus sp. YT1]NMI82728.1 hypothetical protein [Candidatus Nitrosopumilus sp. MTA1]NWJ84285.1 hypothetical protein [Marine Group I thaumarchaeote]NWK01374.1 hypothetical protein [Marine Group I thaumarchaeote]NWK13847.1 hypothetical protein [Marine Group I thaumarchaeote]